MINWENIHNRILEIKSVAEREHDTEQHHIIPKHDDGTNDSDNLILLPRRYHVLIHYVRWRWKQQLGDYLSFKMMSGQLKNPMNDPIIRAIHKAKMNDLNHKQLLREKMAIYYSNDANRVKVSDHRKYYISTLSDRSILTAHLNSSDIIEKRRKSLLLYCKNNPEKVKESQLKGSITNKINNSMKSKEEIINKYSRGKSIENPNWQGYYLLQNNGTQYIFDDFKELKRETKLSDIIIREFVNTNVPIFYDNRIGNKKWEGWFLLRTKEPENAIWIR